MQAAMVRLVGGLGHQKSAIRGLIGGFLSLVSDNIRSDGGALVSLSASMAFFGVY
jgi:hypothetical protein